MSTCRSCGADIIWAETEKGKSIPLDWEPTLRLGISPGLFVLRKGVALELPRVDEQLVARVSHFATCPEVDQWRKA